LQSVGNDATFLSADDISYYNASVGTITNKERQSKKVPRLSIDYDEKGEPINFLVQSSRQRS